MANKIVKDIKCPSCKQLMEPGIFSVQGSFSSFIFYGLSHENLWFKANDKSGDKQIVIGSGKHSNGFRCSACNISLIRDEYLTEFEAEWQKVRKSFRKVQGKP